MLVLVAKIALVGIWVVLTFWVVHLMSKKILFSRKTAGEGDYVFDLKNGDILSIVGDPGPLKIEAWSDQEYTIRKVGFDNKEITPVEKWFGHQLAKGRKPCYIIEECELTFSEFFVVGNVTVEIKAAKGSPKYAIFLRSGDYKDYLNNKAWSFGLLGVLGLVIMLFCWLM